MRTSAVVALLKRELDQADRVMARYIGRPTTAGSDLDLSDRYHNLSRAIAMLEGEPTMNTEPVREHYLLTMRRTALSIVRCASETEALQVGMAETGALAGLKVQRIHPGDWLVLDDRSVVVIEELPALMSSLKVARVDPVRGLTGVRGRVEVVAVSKIVSVIPGDHARFRTHVMNGERSLCGRLDVTGSSSSQVGCARCTALVTARG